MRSNKCSSAKVNCFRESHFNHGTHYLLNWALSAHGVWYITTFMDANGCHDPKTWDDMLPLRADITSSGVAPWVTTGVHAQYIRQFGFDQMVLKKMIPKRSSTSRNSNRRFGGPRPLPRRWKSYLNWRSAATCSKGGRGWTTCAPRTSGCKGERALSPAASCA